MPGDLGELAVNTRVHTYYPMRTRGCGCAWHPAFPTPSFERAERAGQTSRELCGEIAESCSAVIARSEASKQSSFLSLCSKLDCFAEPVIGRRFAPTRWLAMTKTLTRHRPRKRAIQYSEESVIEPRSRGVLDTPLSRSMTTCGGAATVALFYLPPAGEGEEETIMLFEN
jgi:hypothetical protein